MKFSFAASIIAAVTCAQMYGMDEATYTPTYATPVGMDSDTWSPTNSTMPEERRVTMDDIFELNDDGMWQFKTPDVPKLSFADIDQTAMENWGKEKEAIYADMDSRWVEAWKSYQEAIQAPWNDFLDSVEGLMDETHENDWKTKEEVFDFIT